MLTFILSCVKNKTGMLIQKSRMSRMHLHSTPLTTQAEELKYKRDKKNRQMKEKAIGWLFFDRFGSFLLNNKTNLE